MVSVSLTSSSVFVSFRRSVISGSLWESSCRFVGCEVPGTALSDGSGMCVLFRLSERVTAFTLSGEVLILNEKLERTEFVLTSDLDNLKVGCDLVFKILQMFATNWPLDLLVPFWYVFNLLNCSFVISLEQAVCSILCLLEQCVGSIYG